MNLGCLGEILKINEEKLFFLVIYYIFFVIKLCKFYERNLFLDCYRNGICRMLRYI